MTTPTLSVSNAVALINQTLDYAYPQMVIVGELSSFNISKGKWIYADIKDDESKMKMFGNVWQIPGPMENGMAVEVVCRPRLHNQFGFSLQIESIRPVGEGSIKRASDLLRLKLEKEGLFALERKRAIDYPPQKIGLIASTESAGYSDFIKILGERWPIAEVEVYNVAVQGVDAPSQIMEAIDYFSECSQPPDVIVITRGGGSSDDLSAFSDERVVRKVSSSRVPTLIAIGHERDESLAELVSDVSASTPSNAAEVLVPDRKEELSKLLKLSDQLQKDITDVFLDKMLQLNDTKTDIEEMTLRSIQKFEQRIKLSKDRLINSHPKNLLSKGYVFVQVNGRIIKSAKEIRVKDSLSLMFKDGEIKANVTKGVIL